MSDPVNAIHVTFGGICSFVRRKDDQGVDQSVHVLLMEPYYSKGRGKDGKRLRKHDRYLIFRMSDLEKHSGSQPFFKSMLGPFPLETGKDLESIGIWKLDALDLDIRTDAVPVDKTPIFGAQKILKMDGYTLGVVAPHRLDESLNLGLVGARFKFTNGSFSDGQITKQKWAMCIENKSCSATGNNLAQTIEYKLDLEADPSLAGEKVRIFGKSPNGKVRWLALDLGSRVVVSNLCPCADHGPRYERDVLAYYDLCADSLPVDQRRIPRRVAPIVTPQASACPPAEQTGG